MTNNFKKIIDRQMWVQTAPTSNAHSAGMGLACDMRNDMSRNPVAYQLTSATVLNRYNFVTKSWDFLGSPALGGTFGAGAGCVFAPSFSLVGTLAAGATLDSIVIGTPFPTAVGANMLSNRGGSGEFGFRVRIIGNAAGSSGLIEERWIIANSEGTTPTIVLSNALSFTPVAGDGYEIISGKLYMLSAGVQSATSFKSLEVASNTLASLSQTNLPSTVSTDFSAVALDEQYVPYDRKPGEGFISGSATYDVSGSVIKGCLQATGIGAATLTGQATGGDSTVLENEYRNFQIRIVEDTSIPTAVNQRRIIKSHTAGASPVYTTGTNWTVTPSSNAKYVIENPNVILLWTTANAVTYTYNYTTQTISNGTNSINANAWHVTYFGNRGGNMGAGCTSIPSFGIEPDVNKYSRHSYVFSFRGGNTSTLDMLDIAGGTTGLWSNNIVYDGKTKNLTTGSCGKYAPFDNEGRFGYLDIYTASLYNQIYRFDVKARVLATFTPTDWIQAGTAAAGDRLVACCVIDGNDRYSMLLLISHLSTIAQEFLTLV